MPDADLLPFSTLKSLVKEKRFGSGQDTTVPHWIRAAYQWVWDAADWTFKRVEAVALSVSTASPTMPTDFASIIDFEDNNGDPLPEFEPREARRAYASITGTGPPEGFYVQNRQIVICPAPDTTYACTITYRRRRAHRNNALSVVAGPLSADTDYTLWDDHQLLLVAKAQAIGLKALNDPTWGALDDEADSMLVGMISDYVQSRSRPRQYGRVAW